MYVPWSRKEGRAAKKKKTGVRERELRYNMGEKGKSIYDSDPYIIFPFFFFFIFFKDEVFIRNITIRQREELIRNNVLPFGPLYSRRSTAADVVLLYSAHAFKLTLDSFLFSDVC